MYILSHMLSTQMLIAFSWNTKTSKIFFIRQQLSSQRPSGSPEDNMDRSMTDFPFWINYFFMTNRIQHTNGVRNNSKYAESDTVGCMPDYLAVFALSGPMIAAGVITNASMHDTLTLSQSSTTYSTNTICIETDAPQHPENKCRITEQKQVCSDTGTPWPIVDPMCSLQRSMKATAIPKRL